MQAEELLAEDEHLAALARAGPAEDLDAGRLDRLLGAHQLDLDDPLGKRGSGLQRLGEPLSHPLLHHQAVDHDRDVVLELLVELDPAFLVEAAQLAVDHGPGVALAAHLLQQLPVLALAPAHDRCQDHEPGPLVEGHDAIGDLLERLAGDRLAAVVAMRLADARPQQA